LSWSNFHGSQTAPLPLFFEGQRQQPATIPKSLSSADLCFPPVANKHIYGKFPGGHGPIDIAPNFNSQYDKNTAGRPF
jgi:hypothetical protein